MGNSGNIGQVAFALGHVDGYSVGIGENEHVNHMTRIGRQTNPPAAKFDADGNRIKTGGSYEGIYLPGLAITVSRKIATTLLGHSDIRTRIGCRMGACAASIAGPLHDYKTHYLHARASEMAALLDKPTTWRSKAEGDRLVRALEMRELINEKYQAKGQPTLKTRTLVSLLEDIEKERAKLAA